MNKMSIIERIKNFFEYIALYFKNMPGKENDVLLLEEKKEFQEEKTYENFEENSKIEKRTLISKLYLLEQQIEVLKNDFPEKYDEFLGKIRKINEKYNSTLIELKKDLTFEIDPEINSSMILEVNRLEREISKFIDNEVKFYMISNKLQTLIVKINILYNVSICHYKDSDKEKVMAQIERAKEVEQSIIQDFKGSSYILNDNQLRDRIITLLYYLDYEILKTILRNTRSKIDDIIDELTKDCEFKRFDILGAFKAYVQDEISDLEDIIYLVKDENYRQIFQKQISKMIKEVTFSDDSYMLNHDFWNSFLLLESNILEAIKECDTSKDIDDKAKIKLIDRINIEVLESDVITKAKTNAYISLMQIFSTTRNEKILLLIKLFKKLSNDVTYKEIYFLIQLFDVLEVIKSVPNSLEKYIKRYEEKYPYDTKTIEKKKNRILESKEELNKYLVVIDSNCDDIAIDLLEKLNFDFKFEGDKILLNSFYFNGLENVLDSFDEIKQDAV